MRGSKGLGVPVGTVGPGRSESGSDRLRRAGSTVVVFVGPAMLLVADMWGRGVL